MKTRFVVTGDKIPKSVPLIFYSTAIDYALFYQGKYGGEVKIEKVRI